MHDLYENVYDSTPPIVDGLLYASTYLFVGAPKVDKSFLMAQLAHHVSMGIKLWGYEVKKGHSVLSRLGGYRKAIAGAIVPFYKLEQEQHDSGIGRCTAHQ